MNEHDVTLLSAYLDGVLAPAEAKALEQELRARPELAAELGALREQDAALSAAFAPLRRAAESRAAATLVPGVARPEGERELSRGGEPSTHPRPWGWLLAGLAAGALVTGTLLRWGAAPAPPSLAPESAPPLARLEHALGPIESVDAGGGAGAQLPTGAELRTGSGVRTPPGGKSTLLLADGTHVRLDGSTELVLLGPRRVALRRGRVHAEVRPAEERFLAEAGPSLVEVLGTRLDLTQRLGAAGSEHAGRELTELAVLEGSALLCGTRVEAGMLATALDGRFEHVREAQDLLLATSWVNELLAFEPEREREFQERIDALLAMLGRTKMAHLYEWEIRSLGDHCALPILRYVESADSRGEPARRRDAARILADVAAPRHLAGLAELLTDADAEVRVSAARGIERLTGGLGSGDAADFRGDGFAELAARWRAELERR